jgi:hypothetical protein
VPPAFVIGRGVVRTDPHGKGPAPLDGRARAGGSGGLLDDVMVRHMKTRELAEHEGSTCAA